MARRFHRQNGPYVNGHGHYWTWRKIHVLSCISRPLDREQRPWNAKCLSDTTGISYKGVREMLKTMKEQGFVQYCKDAYGRDHWEMTSRGRHEYYSILDRRLQKWQMEGMKTWDYPDFVKRVPVVIKKLREMGWRDTDARTAVYKIPLGRIENTINFCARRKDKIRNMGAYVRTTLLKRHTMQWRLEKYAEAFNERGYNFSERTAQELARFSKLQQAPFKSFRVIAEAVHNQSGAEHYSPALGSTVYELQQAGVVKGNRRAIRKYQQGDYVYAYDGPRRTGSGG